MNLRYNILADRSTRLETSFAAILTIVVAVSLWSMPAKLLAGGGPENVVLVVNADSASSKMLANYYIHGRNIPSRNVIYLNNIPDREIVKWKSFRQLILEPLIREIEFRKLGLTADYIVYSSDFPTTIDIADHRKKLLERMKGKLGKDLPANLFNGHASLTSLTYYIVAALSDEPSYMLLDSNNYYRMPAEVLLRRPFGGDQQVLFEKTIAKINSDSEEELDDAIKTLAEFGKKNPRQLAVYYWMAKFHAKKGDARNATGWLTQSVRLGWCYQQQTRADLAFEKVKDDPLFRGIVGRIPDLPFEYAPTHGFKSSYSWGLNGMINTEPGQGNRHFLSTILSVTRNQGINEKQALQQIQRSIAADETKPQGTFYFTDTADVRSTTRKPNFAVAIEQLEAMGFKTEVVTQSLPFKARDVVGLTCGTAGFNWIASGSKIIPGAFCDNLTSYGGMFHKPGQTKCIQFLLNGAAGASGTVIEPYSIQQKFPHPMIHVHYARGCSMAEAFYQSVHGPFQTIVVGDALCQPWATRPVLTLTGMKAGDVVKGKVELKLDASESPVPIALVEFFVDGLLVVRTKMQETIAFDTSDMTDGHHEIRLVATANNIIQATGSVVLPVTINNRGESTTITSGYGEYLDTDRITVQAKSNFGDSIELMHNGRSVAKKIGKDVEFKIPAKLLGRGPVKVLAVSIAESGLTVASTPLDLEITGRISELVRDTEPKKQPALNKPGVKKPTTTK